MIAVIDYGMGNVGSVVNMLKKVGVKAVATAKVAELDKARKLIFPGVGSFDNGMKKLQEHGLIEFLNRKVLEEKTPILGLCLGMQLFSRRSEEGGLPGLGWINADTVRFNPVSGKNSLKIPHMGWNQLKIRNRCSLWGEMEEDPRFYFVHSYHVRCEEEDNIAATCFYGYEFVAAVANRNIYGTQFHPEKSHNYGIQLFRNFVEMC